MEHEVHEVAPGEYVFEVDEAELKPDTDGGGLLGRPSMTAPDLAERLRSAYEPDRDEGVVYEGSALDSYLNEWIASYEVTSRAGSAGGLERLKRIWSSRDSLQLEGEEQKEKLSKIFNIDLISHEQLVTEAILGIYPVYMDLLNEGLSFVDSDTWKQYAETFADFESWMIENAELQRSPRDAAITVDFCRALQRTASTLNEDIAAYREANGTEEVLFEKFSETIQIYPQTKKKTSADKIVELLNTRAIQPNKMLSANSKVANNLGAYLPKAIEEAARDNDGGEAKRNALAVEVGKNCDVLISASYTKENMKLEGGDYTEFDALVNNAFSTLIEAGNTAITLSMVYRTMNGLSNTERVSDASLAEIRDSIEKQRRIHLDIDARQQIERWNIVGADGKRPEYYRDDFLIVAERQRVIINGVECDAYIPHTMPILMKYSIDINQVISIPQGMLDIKDTRKDKDGKIVEVMKVGPDQSSHRTIIKNYLAKQIRIMERNKKYSRRIMLESIYEISGINTENKTSRQRIRDFAFTALDYEKAAGYIKGYRTDGGKTKKGGHRRYTYIDIIL